MWRRWSSSPVPSRLSQIPPKLQDEEFRLPSGGRVGRRVGGHTVRSVHTPSRTWTCLLTLPPVPPRSPLGFLLLPSTKVWGVTTPVEEGREVGRRCLRSPSPPVGFARTLKSLGRGCSPLLSSLTSPSVKPPRHLGTERRPGTQGLGSR